LTGLQPLRIAKPVFFLMLGYILIKTSEIERLEQQLRELKEKNEYLMMTHYSARAAREIQDEIREIINCSKGNNIIDAIKQLKEKSDAN